MDKRAFSEATHLPACLPAYGSIPPHRKGSVPARAGSTSPSPTHIAAVNQPPLCSYMLATAPASAPCCALRLMRCTRWAAADRAM